jgi:hypothetical protein
MSRLFLVLFAFLGLHTIHAQWDGNTSPNYEELIGYLKKLDKSHAEIELYAMGPSDYDLPIYLCVINGARDSTKTFEKARRGTTLLINNAIHAGEPDGINACLLWLDQWIANGKVTKNLPLISFIPAYNVGGMMNRNGTSRANQNGPEEYGFRGNAQNLDLNRDFMKMDAENTFTFVRIFHALDPDVFVDTHVSNGADYQYTLTYISSLKERLSPSIKEITYDKMIPWMTKELKKDNWDLFPYVELKGETPEDGLVAFNDLPRYAMGYASLFHSISFTTETHMLKPFPKRVQSTLAFLKRLIDFTSQHTEEIETARMNSILYWNKKDDYSYAFQLSDIKDSLRFKGYTFSKPMSEVTHLPRLKYHVDQPFEKYVPWYGTYVSNASRSIPKSIIVGGQCKNVIERLTANQVTMKRLTKDTVMIIEKEKVFAFDSPSKPYEGHYYHGKLQSDVSLDTIALKKGDVIIPTNQSKRLFVLAACLADAEDSYFRWNFFDSYLQQKEYFSAYVFEDKALEILTEKPWLKEELERLKKTDKTLEKSTWEQLMFIYKNSDMFEETVNVLPIFYSND